jgi:hypothetical protein
MFIPATNVPCTLWAACVFRAIANFDGSAPVFSVDVIGEATRGMTFLELDVSNSMFLIARFRLDVPLEVSERVTATSVQGLAIVPINPFVPTTSAKAPGGTPEEASSLYEQVIFATDPSPPQGSPEVILELHGAVFRRVPS